ncbi:cell division cycle 5-like protein [Dorcoceras hygrometricum]|uniref:Cell division cycle 5-like protein n=1 Tax=Dorcoceras hygrometricum TaxID=472368 RepID=A0A2Z7BPR6_9LAMI|nr:cell division cycle 5-like protein [Dorcoceras hygrometricum]
MRIRSSELETSICDAKYHVSLVCPVTLAMSLFDLQDVCIVIGSLATLDLPMVVDLIGIYVLKGPYYRSDQIVDLSYDEVTVIGMNRMFIRWTGPTPAAAPPPNSPLGRASTHAPPPAAACAAACRDRTCSDRLDEEIPFVSNSSDLLVQTDEGILILVVDLIKENLPPPTLKCRIPCESGRSQAPRRQQCNIH